jgi:hypothetical protein
LTKVPFSPKEHEKKTPAIAGVLLSVKMMGLLRHVH